MITESALRIDSRPVPDRDLADAVARHGTAKWQSVSVSAADGVVLSGWLFTPRDPNGSGVILLHGVGDTRQGVMGHAQYLLDAGFTVLAPDSRGHGISGGSVITYGIRESGDVHAWADWLYAHTAIARLYGLGESMGAAILLQSIQREPRFRAVVAEAPFDSFEDIAYYRLERVSSLGRWAAWPVVQTGFLYTRAVHWINLRQASPVQAIRSASIPILLIHGTRDVNIPMSQSMALHAANPQWTTLWIVEGARHVSAIGVNPKEYVRRVTGWFESH